MELVAIVIALALMQYVAFGMLVGRARIKYGVKAPATSGHEVFERYFRVHQNTLELMTAFAPSVWLFGTYVSPPWAAGLGLVYFVGRLVYLRSYVTNPATRGAGFGLSALPIMICTVGALVGAASKAFGG
jgi:glutathione S-transferase